MGPRGDSRVAVSSRRYADPDHRQHRFFSRCEDHVVFVRPRTTRHFATRGVAWGVGHVRKRPPGVGVRARCHRRVGPRRRVLARGAADARRAPGRRRGGGGGAGEALQRRLRPRGRHPRAHLRARGHHVRFMLRRRGGRRAPQRGLHRARRARVQVARRAVARAIRVSQGGDRRGRVRGGDSRARRRARALRGLCGAGRRSPRRGARRARRPGTRAQSRGASRGGGAGNDKRRRRRRPPWFSPTPRPWRALPARARFRKHRRRCGDAAKDARAHREVPAVVRNRAARTRPGTGRA